MRITYDAGFTQMPNTILRSHVLKPLHKVVLGVICSYSNDSNIAFPSYQTIANDSGISRRKTNYKKSIGKTEKFKLFFFV